MAIHNNPSLLFISLSLLLFHLLARLDHLSPSPSPGPHPDPSPSAGPRPGPSQYHGPFPPSKSISPHAVADVDRPVVSHGRGPSPTPKAYADVDADRPTLANGPAPIPTAHVDPRVKEICDSTDHPDLCLATVVPGLDGDYDVPTVLEVSIRAGAGLARAGFLLVKKMANSPACPPELGSVLRDCTDSYDNVVYDFERAMDAFMRRDEGTMNTMLSAVITNVGDCEDGLARFRDGLARFMRMADKLTDMTSNCLAIASLLG